MEMILPAQKKIKNFLIFYCEKSPEKSHIGEKEKLQNGYVMHVNIFEWMH